MAQNEVFVSDEGAFLGAFLGAVFNLRELLERCLIRVLVGFLCVSAVRLLISSPEIRVRSGVVLVIGEKPVMLCEIRNQKGTLYRYVKWF